MQKAKFAKKVHKPPLWVNVINFELIGLDASIWVPWSSSDPKKSLCTNRSIQIHKKQAAPIESETLKIYFEVCEPFCQS